MKNARGKTDMQTIFGLGLFWFTVKKKKWEKEVEKKQEKNEWKIMRQDNSMNTFNESIKWYLKMCSSLKKYIYRKHDERTYKYKRHSCIWLF